MQNKFGRSFVTNWVLKVISFIVAVFIVIAIRFLNVTDRSVTIPLEVKTTASVPYVPVSLIPETIDVIIKGDQNVIYLVDPSQIKASVDFRDVRKEGIERREVNLEYDEDIFVSKGLTITSKPTTIRILFKKR